MKSDFIFQKFGVIPNLLKITKSPRNPIVLKDIGM